MTPATVGPRSSPDPIHVYFALLPHSLLLDWAGPAEALRMANQALLALGQPERFVLHFVSPTPQSVTSVGVHADGACATARHRHPAPPLLGGAGRPARPAH